MARSGSTARDGSASPPVSRWRRPAAGNAATNRPSTTRPAPTSRRRGRSKRSSRRPRLACASTPDTSCWAAAIRCRRCTTGGRASTTSTSRTQGGRSSNRSCARRRPWPRSGGAAPSAGWARATSTSKLCSISCEATTPAGSSSSRTCCPTPTVRLPPTSEPTAATSPSAGSEEMAPLRIGLAGAGRMGRNHLRALADSAEVKVTAIAEPAEATRDRLRDTDVALYAGLDEMLSSASIDAVLVCVPSDLHLATVKRLVEAGLPTLCEKPVGVTAGEARDAATAVAAAGLPFQVGFWRRFVPMLKGLRERIRAGELGQIYAVANFQWDGSPPGAEFRAHSGGIFVDMGVHEFDQTRWLVGQEFGEVVSLPSGVAAEPFSGDPESAHALAALSGGTTAILSLGRRFPLGDVCKVEVFGTSGAEECKFLWPPDADATFFGALRAQAESFPRHVRGGPLEGASAADAAAALEAAQRAAAQAVRA